MRGYRLELIAGFDNPQILQQMRDDSVRRGYEITISHLQMRTISQTGSPITSTFRQFTNITRWAAFQVSHSKTTILFYLYQMQQFLIDHGLSQQY